MQLFTSANIDWLKLKWMFISLSLILLVIGWITVVQRGGFIYGIDFTGGTLVKLKFTQTPNISELRTTLNNSSLEVAEITRFDEASKNMVQVKLAKVASEQAARFQHIQAIMYTALSKHYDQNEPAGQQDLNRASKSDIASELKKSRVLENMGQIKSDASLEQVDNAYTDLATKIVDYRTEHGGLIANMDNLVSEAGIPQPVVDHLKKAYFPGAFAIVGIDSVGPKIGSQLRSRAEKAVILALVGMLVYIAIRFKFAYGVAAIIALFHDVLITLGLFSLFNKEISLTVVAALLTLVGYSINDTIIVFDRIRENLKLMRNETFGAIINKAINQTLSRTVITSGLTFVAVFCLWMFGGQSLEGFSLVLVVGILVGTYSSIAIASPILFWWFKYLGSAKEKKAVKMA